jgi:hypothetical protein
MDVILAFVKHVTQRAVVQYHNFTKVWFNRAQILYEGTVSKCTMLAVISTREELAFLFQPIDYGICVFLDGSSENNKVVPFTDLEFIRIVHIRGKNTHSSEEVIAMRSLVNIVKNGMLRAECWTTASSHERAEFHFHHMPGTHPATLCHAVD